MVTALVEFAPLLASYAQFSSSIKSPGFVEAFVTAMADPRRMPHKNGLERAIWVSKIGFLILGILSAGVSARQAIPPAAGVLASVLPRFWASLSSWLAPPYLFVVIHIIILVIWKLSDQKQHHLDQRSVEETPADAADVVKAKYFEPPSVVPLDPEPSPEGLPDIPPSPKSAPAPIAGFCASQPSDENNIEAVEEHSAWSSFEIKTSVEAWAEISEVELEEEFAAAVAELKNDSMEETWKAITANTPGGGVKLAKPEALPPPVVAIKGRLSSVTGREELNQRFDDFIKNRYEQFRLQRLESNQRRLEMLNNISH